MVVPLPEEPMSESESDGVMPAARHVQTLPEPQEPSEYIFRRVPVPVPHVSLHRFAAGTSDNEEALA